MDEVSNKILEEIRNNYEKNRQDIRARFSGKELKEALRKLNEMEKSEIHEFESRENPQEMKRILERRLKEVSEYSHRIEKQYGGNERQIALKENDAYRKSLESRIDELRIYDNPPDHFPPEPGIKELLYRQRVLKNGTAQEKREILNRIERERIQKDALKRTLQEKFKDPVYRQEVVASFKSRIRLFRIYVVLLLVGVIGSIAIANNIGSDSIKFFVLVIFVVSIAMYIHFGRKFYKCPVCGYKLDFLSKYSSRSGKFGLNTSKLLSCPRCDAPFR